MKNIFYYPSYLMKQLGLLMSSLYCYSWFQVQNKLTGVLVGAVGSGTALQAESRGLNYRWDSLGVDLASNKNEYHGISWGGG
jgi:hypothetical protein